MPLSSSLLQHWLVEEKVLLERFLLKRYRPVAGAKVGRCIIVAILEEQECQPAASLASSLSFLCRSDDSTLRSFLVKARQGKARNTSLTCLRDDPRIGCAIDPVVVVVVSSR